jgi:peptidoglycan/LPS O-acetylase OafA/YrhL
VAAKQKIAPLTSLRFFAAFLVVLYHTAPGALRKNPYVPIENLVAIGLISVSFFFTLSGYILAVVYLQSGAVIDTRRFWLARFARIYPLFFVSLLLDLPNLFLFRVTKYGWKAAALMTGATLTGNALMLQAWIQKLNTLNLPVWSLSVETLFYLLFPLVGWWLWKASARSSVTGAAALYAAGMAAVGVAIHIARMHHYSYVDLIKFHPFFHLHEFLIGVLVARWHTLQLAQPESHRRLKRLAPCIAAIALLLFVGVVCEFERFPFLYLHDGLLYFNDGVLLPLYVLMIVAFGSGNDLIDRIFSVSWLVVLGEASYGLYLIHFPINEYWKKIGLSEHLWLYPVYLVMAVGTSVLSFYCFETPARKWILRRAHIHSKETIMASSAAQ